LKIRIGSLLDLSTIDWYRHTVFMIFCAGCNFRCSFCSNSSLIPIDSGGDVNLELIKNRVLKNMGFLDALGFTGGEPSLQPRPIIELCDWAKKKGLKTFLNTNGSNPTLIDDLTGKNILDYVALDIKAPLRPGIYGWVSGLDKGVEIIIANIKETLDICRRAGLPLEVRTTIVPTLIDDETSIREIARSVRSCTIYVIQEFFPFKEVLNEQLRGAKPPRRELLIKLAKLALEEGVKDVYVRTRENGMEKIML